MVSTKIIKLLNHLHRRIEVAQDEQRKEETLHSHDLCHRAGVTYCIFVNKKFICDQGGTEYSPEDCQCYVILCPGHVKIWQKPFDLCIAWKC